jgi:hypothetical protein
MLLQNHKPGQSGQFMVSRADQEGHLVIGGPAWIRTKDQGIHVAEAFPLRVDYLFTLGS